MINWQTFMRKKEIRFTGRFLYHGRIQHASKYVEVEFRRVQFLETANNLLIFSRIVQN